MNYEDNELLKQIREEYGHNRTAERITDTTGFIQNELGPSTPIGSTASRPEQRAKYTVSADDEQDRSFRRLDETDAGGVRRSNATDDQNISGADQDNRAIDNAVLSNGRKQRGRRKLEDKPSGLAMLPDMRELQERVQPDQQQQPEKKQILSSFLDKAKTLINPDEKTPTKKVKEPTRKKPLSKEEIEQYRQPALDALLYYFQVADEIIYATCKTHEHVQIWTSIDQEDAAFLVERWLAKASRDAKKAGQLVAMVDKYDDLRVAAIIGPRAYGTLEMYIKNGIGIK